MKPDLSSQVTVFVSTVGAPSFGECMQWLREQDCLFRLEIIDHVAPMNVAFQRMLDSCTTPYFVQVDEDMLLYPDAIRVLHAQLAALPERVALYAADLFDEHLDRCIIGVKIFRHAIVSRYPFGDRDDFEMAQIRALERDGYRVVRAERSQRPVPGRTLGLHVVHWTPPMLYRRYRSLMRRIIERKGEMKGYDALPGELLRRFIAEPSEENFMALAGLITGRLLADPAAPAEAKDYRDYDSSDLDLVQRLYRDCTQRSPISKRAP